MHSSTHRFAALLLVLGACSKPKATDDARREPLGSAPAQLPEPVVADAQPEPPPHPVAAASPEAPVDPSAGLNATGDELERCSRRLAGQDPEHELRLAQHKPEEPFADEGKVVHAIVTVTSGDPRADSLGKKASKWKIGPTFCLALPVQKPPLAAGERIEIKLTFPRCSEVASSEPFRMKQECQPLNATVVRRLSADGPTGKAECDLWFALHPKTAAKNIPTNCKKPR